MMYTILKNLNLNVDFEEVDFENILFSTVADIFEEEEEEEKEERQAKRLCRTGIPGKQYVEELLNCGHEDRIYQVLRMQLVSFYALQDWCLEHTKLRSSRNQKHIRGVTIEEKLAIFLFIVGKGASNRDTQEQFSHSGRTISQYII